MGFFSKLFKKKEGELQQPIQVAPQPPPPPAPPKPKYVVENHKVAGITFHKEALERLKKENDAYSFSKKDLIDFGMVGERVYQYEYDTSNPQLVPDPDNPEDKNAIKVIVGGEHIGFIKKGSCSHIKKLMQSGNIVSVECEIAGGKYKFVFEGYDEDRDREVYTLERDEQVLFASLAIRIKKDEE